MLYSELGENFNMLINLIKDINFHVIQLCYGVEVLRVKNVMNM